MEKLKCYQVVRKRKRKSGKGSLASAAWPANILLLSSCPRKSEGFLLILRHALVGPFSPPFLHLPYPHSLQLCAPTNHLFLPPSGSRPSWWPPGSLHLPLSPDGGSPQEGPERTYPRWERLPAAECKADSQERSPSLSLRDSRLLSAGWEGGVVSCVSQLPRSSQLSPRN